ncbi:MAG: methionyl-tRNA formyltransferase [Acidaminococcales bacterium]|jgi:methionyl-tRNA formyltransferase|nr:methionyl-tRNA formyltransferase [Acidaminococcales bacterium]
MALRVIFMGTPAFAVPALKILHEQKHELVLVVTQPDRPRGRGQALAASPVKQAALALRLDVVQPLKIREPRFVEHLRALSPDVIIVAAFGQLLSEEILKIPPYGCINLHASLLPKYRGAAPIHWSVLNGEKETGNTVMLMDKGMDTGAILMSNRIAIGDDETTGEVHDRLAVSGALLLAEALEKLKKRELTPTAQDDERANYAPKLTGDLEIIDWRVSSAAVFNKIRGLYPWPVAYTFTEHGRLKIHAARLYKKDARRQPPGRFAGLTGDGFLVAAADGVLEILKVQPESKKIMPALDFAKGYIAGKGEGLYFGRKSDV